ncbi:hypothetical protein [Vibrio aestuarianus]|uniref:hypothetical protein n=1 Tax=Vibrio aestuarianus TaxID=28171 RepID=UPI00237D00CB|nr:hypothetical protein [Vibrio aestuarianus]MDE1233395.1 hypothetical protein [Vibrio aestuarianus]
MSSSELKPEFLKLALNFLGKLLVFSFVGLLGVVASVTLKNLGPTHALSAFGIGAFICMAFVAIDNWSSNSISKLQWAALVVNVFLLSYTFLLLPTQEALSVLNDSGVKQNFWEVLKSWW